MTRDLCRILLIVLPSIWLVNMVYIHLNQMNYTTYYQMKYVREEFRDIHVVEASADVAEVGE